MKRNDKPIALETVSKPGINAPTPKSLLRFTKVWMAAIFLILLTWESNAQRPATNEPYRHSTFVMGVPQHLIQNGIRIEIDKPLGHMQHWLIVAPTMYYKGKQGSWFSRRRIMDSMQGAGLEMMYRYYPGWRSQGGGAYFSAGGGIRYINFRYTGYRWHEYMQDGLTFYRYETGSWSRNLTTSSVRFTMGYQRVYNRHFTADLFVGAGFRYTVASQPSDVTVIFDSNNPENLDYTGLHLTGGIRFGMGW